MTWQTHALCTLPGNDPAWWFPPLSRAGRGLNPDHVAKAVEVCELRPVRRQCLADALAVEVDRGRPIAAAQRVGIYGGKTPVERWAIATGAGERDAA